MKHWRSFLVAVALFFWVGILIKSGRSQTANTSITIQNYSFGSPSTSTYQLATPTSWTLPSGSAGVWRPQTYNVGFSAPSGSQTAYINSGGMIAQTLGDGLWAGTYSFRVDVCSRGDAYPSHAYSVELRAGTTVIASANQTSVPLEDGACRTVALLPTIASNHPALGQPLSIRLGSTSGQTSFDFVRLFLSHPVPPIVKSQSSAFLAPQFQVAFPRLPD